MRSGSRPPDVVGYPLEEARRILAAAGWVPGDITETRPPRRTLTGPLRVVRQRAAADGRIALAVCGERVEDGAPLPPVTE